MKSFIKKIKQKELYNVFKIQSCVIKTITDFMYKNKVLQLMPVILAPETDPLCHSTLDASIDYYGQKLHLTKSMILHKQIALIPKEISKIYIMSPNIRLETKDLNNSGKHLIEFTQLDVEFKNKTKKDFMNFTEDLVIEIFKSVKRECKKDLEKLVRTLNIPKKPFKVYESKNLKEKYDQDFEALISEKSKEPFWILNYEREFYDREDEKQREYYHNYDLVWPEGFGEALSGGEREFEYKEILRKMKKGEINLETYEHYLELAKLGMLQKTVGGGLGIERLIRYITRTKEIRDILLFPRIPGEKMVI